MINDNTININKSIKDLNIITSNNWYEFNSIKRDKNSYKVYSIFNFYNFIFLIFKLNLKANFLW